MTMPSDYAEVMLRWSQIAERRGLTHSQTAVLASQFAGCVVSNAGLSVEGQGQMLKVCQDAMSTACANKALREAAI